MPKKVVEDVNVEDEIMEAAAVVEETAMMTQDNEELADTVDKKREELIKLAEDGELDKPVGSIKKASKKTIEKLHADYERKRMRKANEFLTDLLISKFSDTLRGLDAIESSEEITNELYKDELLRKDVCNIVEMVFPYIPLIGILSGGITTAKYIYKHNAKNI